MKIPARLFVFALPVLAVSCGTVAEDSIEGPELTIGSEVSSTALAGGERATDEALPESLYGSAAAPAGEVGALPSDVPAEFAHLETLDAEAIVPGNVGAGRFLVKLRKARFVGNLTLENKRSAVAGAGEGYTVIDGNLIVGSLCRVSGLTVTGDVIFTGNGAQVDVDCRGQVLDYGLQNRH